MALCSTKLTLLLALGTVWGCAPAPTTVVVNNSVTVSVSGGHEQGKVPAQLDLGDPRIAAAQREITKLIGAPLSFELDGTLIPSFADTLHAAFVAALESTVTQLEYCRDHRPKDFAFGRTRLKTLRWVYTASKDPAKPQLDVASGALVVVVASDAKHLLLGGMIIRAFIDARDHDQRVRFRNLPADKVATVDHESYFELQARAEDPDLEAVANVLALYPHVSEPKLRARTRDWLVDRGASLRSRLSDSVQLPTTERAHVLAVHESWIRWVNERRTELDTEEQREVARLIFNGRYRPWAEFRKGFDTRGFAKPHFDGWLGAARAKKEAPNDLALTVACPFTRDGGDARLIQRDCNGALYVDLFAVQGGAKQLAQLCVREKVDALTEAATLHVASQLGIEAAVELLDAMGADDGASRTALSALAAFSAWGPKADDSPALTPDLLLARIPSWWTAHPSRRPELLVLLVKLGERYPGKVAWATLPQYLGSRITADELAAFLERGSSSLAALPRLAAGLSEGWSRSGIVIPKLQAWLEHYVASDRRGLTPHHVTEQAFEFLCRVGTERDITDLHAFVRNRLAKFPEEQDLLRTLGERTPRELCPKFKYEAPKEPILFGD